MKILKKGFTMIELLVVISIIGILATLILVSYTSSQKQARDTERKSDTKQYQTLLEAYANSNNGVYPLKTAAVDISSICTTLGETNCPTDPKPTEFTYKYITNDTATEYLIWANLESQSGSFWVVCSRGKVGVSQTAPAGASCPASL